MKNIYKLGACYGSYFLDETGELITYIHENDGNWRNEYFAPILKYLRAKMIDLYVPEMKDCPENEDYLSYYEENIKNIKKQIKKIK